MRKLVIGCGYLGRRVAAAWLEDAHQVTALTRSSEHAKSMRDLGLETVIGDVTQPDSLCALPGADTVLYAVGYDRSTRHSQRKVYVDGLDNVLRAIAGRVSRFLYISSTSVYGQSDGCRVDETSRVRPIRENGRVCLDAENLVWSYFPRDVADSKQGATVLRLAGIYGPGRLLRRVEEITSGQPLPGNPEAYLNLIHVDDAVGAVLASEQRGRLGETYLVCDDQPTKRRDYYAALAEFLGGPVPVFANSSEHFGRSPNLSKRCSNRKIREELGFKPVYPTIATGLPQALKQT